MLEIPYELKHTKHVARLEIAEATVLIRWDIVTSMQSISYVINTHIERWKNAVNSLLICYTGFLLYREHSCIGDFTYHVNIHSQRHLAIVYVRNISIQISNSQLQQKFCKMSNIVTIKCIYLQMACRKQYSAYHGYPRPIKYPSSTS